MKDLPRGSTPLDMAYRIHTDIGDHCAGARIITNMADTGRLVTRLVPLDYELQGGEIVDIVVNRTSASDPRLALLRADGHGPQ